MKVSLIVAMDRNRGIGYKGWMPWGLSDDLKRFKDLTQGRHLLMGRKTWESIGGPLSGRKAIVLSTHSDPIFAGCAMVKSIEEAIAFAQNQGETAFFIGGGAMTYAAALPYAHRLYVTHVEAHTTADTFFPYLDWDAWEKEHSMRLQADDRNQYATEFCLYERMKKG